MFIKINQNAINLNSIVAVTHHGTGQYHFMRVQLLGGGHVDISNAQDGEILMEALNNKMIWYNTEEKA